jgi:hypothetical protein
MSCQVTLEYPAGGNEEIVPLLPGESLDSRIDTVEVFWRVIDEARIRQEVNAIIRLYVDGHVQLEHQVAEVEVDMTPEEEEELDSVEDMIETMAMLLNKDPDDLWATWVDIVEDNSEDKKQTVH